MFVFSHVSLLIAFIVFVAFMGLCESLAENMKTNFLVKMQKLVFSAVNLIAMLGISKDLKNTF